jgi:transcriptional regulator with XRE-family HTH domain
MNIPSQPQVARAFGKVLATCLDRTYPSLLERGLRQPTIGKFIAIGFALRVDPSTLMIMTLVKLREGQP